VLVPLAEASVAIEAYPVTPVIPKNLLVSIAAAAGTDQYGNAYKRGVTAYGATSANAISMQAGESGTNAFVYLFSGRSEENMPAFLTVQTDNIGDSDEYLNAYLNGPQVDTYVDYVYMNLQSPTKDGTGYAGGNLVYVDRSGSSHTLLEWGEGGVVINNGTVNDVTLAYAGEVTEGTSGFGGGVWTADQQAALLTLQDIVNGIIEAGQTAGLWEAVT
jgi:hypothetical protein